ncbi:PREDICTED: lymphocyte function-associated antigen 3 [Elephantulus edwardii]|uniref:lymphocyte function-associated antigen 3 n=1 Tax=Elephantulus edwardii TaxID=28737 RepID=UPI0003F0EF12|nr:PREDICTED: lymphocyte function-associated antigen 3 [Elephantulus edwardii]
MVRREQEFINGNGIEVFGVVNKDITLHPSSDTVFKEITWKKGRNKVVEWYEGSSLYEEFPPFKGRVSLNTTTGALTIMNLTLSDEDNYEIESSDLKAVFFLLVLDPAFLPVGYDSSPDPSALSGSSIALAYHDDSTYTGVKRVKI